MNSILITLADTGHALYGDRWREPIARALQQRGAEKPGVNLRNLHIWLAGDWGRSAPALVPKACLQLLRARASDLEQMADKVEVAHGLGDRDEDAEACTW